MAWTAYFYPSRSPSQRLQIRDWSAAQEIDREAAVYVQKELITREFEKEKRDRDFWTVMFGGEVSESDDAEITLDTAEPRPPFSGVLLGSEGDVIARSPLGQR